MEPAYQPNGGSLDYVMKNCPELKDVDFDKSNVMDMFLIMMYIGFVIDIKLLKYSDGGDNGMRRKVMIEKAQRALHDHIALHNRLQCLEPLFVETIDAYFNPKPEKSNSCCTLQ